LAILEKMLLTLDEISDVTGASISAIRRAMKRNELPYRTLAGRRRVRVADMKKWAGLDD
jgi:predicted DNA-binding transcriptional regulator AlpA